MLALNRAGRQQDALDAYESLRRSLDELWGLEPSAETRALQVMILTQDPAIAPTPTVPPSIGAIRRPVALLLVELMLDEELELEVARAALDEARSSLADVVARHGGSLSPESGVEIVAAFGAEGAREDDVLRAARAAVELREILRGREIDARLAVGTGRLLVEQGRPMLIGAVVGQTRRALHDAEADEILVTPAAARLGGDALELDAHGHLVGVRPGRAGATVAPAPFVGRTAELDAVRTAFAHVVVAGQPRHVVVVGEAGIGKTRLVFEAIEGIGAVVLDAACVAYGEGITFLPLRELAERARAVDADAPELVELTSADAAFSSARTLLEHFTASGPVVVVLDDVHWAVPTFLDLVEYVVRAVAGPLLVVSMTRPELLDERPEWAAGAVSLGALSSEDAAAFVDALPGREALEPTLTDAILETSEGVPLFLEQLVSFAMDSDVTESGIPPTLETLLASRIDLLEPGERGLLERAAVVGRSFSQEEIGALTPREEVREVAGRLGSLERRRFVRAREDDHEFVHALVQDAAYDAIGRPDRAAMHEAFARWLDARQRGDELVGTHLERASRDAAGSPRQALAREAADRLGRSGLVALQVGDNAGARNLLERAAALLEPRDPVRLELECVLGQALKGFGANERAVTILENVETLAREAGDRRLELRAQVELAWPRLVAGSMPASAATELFQSAAEYFEEIDDVQGVARASFGQYLVLTEFENRADEAAKYVARSDAAYERLGLPGETALAAVSIALRGRTPVDEAMALCEESLREGAHRLRQQAYLRYRLAELRALRGDIDGARAAAAESRSVLTDLGDEAVLATSAASVFGSIEALAGNWHEAESIFAAALDFLGGSDHWRAWRAYFTARMGEAALARGDLDAARQLADDSRRLSVVDDSFTEIQWRRVAARVFARSGHPRKAVRLAREAVSMIDLTDDLLEQGEVRLDLADVLVHVARGDEAEAVVREGLALLERKGATLPAARGRERFAALLAEQNRGGRGIGRALRRVTQH